MIAVSVIVPVYNGEKYLKECLDSICGQTLQNIEIICVDDGSADSSYEILKQYQKTDERIQLYQQEHQYAGVARNLGKDHATGEYLAFWDSDDFFDTQALEKLYNKAKQTDADVCVCGGNRYLETNGESYPFTAYMNIKKVPKEEIFNRYTNPDHYLDFTTAVAWNKLFKRQYIEKLDLDFQPVRNGNDAFFTMCAIGLADRIVVLNERLVTYRMIREDSLTNSHDKDPISPIQTWIDIAEKLEKYDGFGERTFANRAARSMISLLSNLREWDAFNKAVNILKDYGFQRMHILPKENGYYYNTWDGECVNHLYQDTPEQFALFLAYSRYIQQMDTSANMGNVKEKLSARDKQVKTLKQELNEYKNKATKQETEFSKLQAQKNKTEKDNEKLKEEISKIRNSWTFRTGKVITWLPGKIRRLFNGEK